MTRLYGERDLPPDAWDGPDPLADMTRQRDEAVKAFQRERARVGRVEKLAEKWRYKGEFGWGAWQEGHGPDHEGYVLDCAAGDLRAALADRPTDDD